jgi:uncharacterized glyoxalase superfamily protein PhnB
MDKQKIIPVLRMLDVSKAKEFYIDWLGFSVDWEHRFGENFPLYMQISGNGIVLHLSEHYGDCIPGAKVIIQLDELEKFHQQLTAKDYRYYKPGIEETEWGTKDMNLTDPFGNKLVFSKQVKE